MNIIFGKENADMLGDRYLLLDLETFSAGEKVIRCYCLVDFHKIPTSEMTMLEHYKRLHKSFVENLEQNNYKICKELIPHLTGKFGGELDSFYQVVGERLQNM